jgi:Protein of unknown function (DUF1569)
MSMPWFVPQEDSSVPKRDLDLASFPAIAAELDRLQERGCTNSGAWDLAQTCNHLAYFIEGTLDGHQYKVPWLLKVLLGRMVLRRILSSGKMREAAPTPQKPLPPAGEDPKAAVARLKRDLERLQSHVGEMHDSPFFGHLTPEEWRRLHLIHCNHHLGFLIPN